jgi:hypothetical protein
VVVEEAGQRVDELMQMRKEKEVEFTQEEKLARERDGAASSGLMNAHREHLKEMDRIRDAERNRMIAKQEETQAAARMEFDTEEAIAVSAIQNRRALADDRIAVIRKDVRNKLRVPESEWQGRAAGWMGTASRKVAMKEREDAEHEAMQKRKNRK